MALRPFLETQTGTKPVVATAFLTLIALTTLPVAGGFYAALVGVNVAKGLHPARFRMAGSLGTAVNSGLNYGTVTSFGDTNVNVSTAVCGNGIVEGSEQCDPPGVNCSEDCLSVSRTLWTYAAPSNMQAESLTAPVLADLDGDRKLEVVVAGQGANYDVLAFRPDGTVLWRAERTGGAVENSPIVVDLENDGRAEVVYISRGTASNAGLVALDAAGQRRFLAPGNFRTGPVAADLDGDGDLEVAVGGASDSRTHVFDQRGQRLWQYSGAMSNLVVGQVQDAVSRRQTLLAQGPTNLVALASGGQRIWSKSVASPLWAPAIAQLDADAETELVYTTRSKELTALDHTGASLWSARLTDADTANPTRPLVTVSGSILVADGVATVKAFSPGGVLNLSVVDPTPGQWITQLVGLQDVDGAGDEVVLLAGADVTVTGSDGSNTTRDVDYAVALNQLGQRVWQVQERWIRGAGVGDLNDDGMPEIVVASQQSKDGADAWGLPFKIVAYTFPLAKAPNALPAAMPGLNGANTNRAGVAFKRGDANHDGRVDIADGQTVKDHVTCLSAAPGCEQPNSLQCKVNQGLCYVYPNCDDAMDANDDGVKDLKDADFINRFQLLGGARPPYPGATLGVDPTSDGLGCEAY
ncbi:MAG: VCBS repeat-containing protein [bacterium]|nr:VCBS repeat-containing protein [bacterium]